MVGLVPLVFGVRRAQLMGFFLVPTMLYFSRYEGRIVDLLSIERRTAPLQAADSVLTILFAVVAAIAGAVLIYILARSSTQLFRRYPVARSGALSTGTLSVGLVLLLALVGWAYPMGPNSSPLAEPSATVTGRIIELIDGDTFRIGSFCRPFRVRLKGVDAPELGTPSGDRARDWAVSTLTDRDVTWTPVGVDVYGRILGYVHLEDGTRVNDEIILLGYAGTMDDYPAKSAQSPRPQARTGKSAVEGGQDAGAQVEPAQTDDAVPWDDNRDGRITCAKARRHGIAPVRRNHPAYPHMLDGDGVVCE